MRQSRLASLITKFQNEITSEWITEQLAPGAMRPGLIKDSDLRADCSEFLRLLAGSIQMGDLTDVSAPEFEPVRQMLAQLSRARTQRGFTPTETAIFLFSLKRPLFSRLRMELNDAAALGEEIWTATELLDRLGLFTTEIALRNREEVIARQQQDMMELSTPVVSLWSGILAVPLIGTLDSARTQIVMETLLQRIVETGSEVAIIDITGVPTVDTLVAQHLMKTVAAARLMGVECIISGIRPQIAQTIVHLAVDLGQITTKASLAEAFRTALQRTGATLANDRPADR